MMGLSEKVSTLSVELAEKKSRELQMPEIQYKNPVILSEKLSYIEG
jgi:hypothetical protein